MSITVDGHEVKSQAERAEEYAVLSNEDLISQLESEAWASDRCVGTHEHMDSTNCIYALREEILKRMRPTSP